MSRVVVTSRVGTDGVLSLAVPMGPADANRVVRVTVETVETAPMVSQEAWQRFVAETGGSITDPTFERLEQGEYERRDAI